MKRPSVVPSGDKDISFAAELLSGKIEGDLSLGKTQASLEIVKGKVDIKSFSVRSDDIDRPWPLRDPR